ncbi:LysE family translocator [Paraburkholderia flava]|uniref:LysE family translocator n=1 Tax=Paraburkholderia flava TaxID=2547393 RepID=UPI00105FE515|nr:LysE family transporter [Paraburkholderia flava]
MPHDVFSAQLLLACTVYLVGTASPGPSNLAIMSLAMSSGRRAALTFACGVLSGSFFWASTATLGLAAVLAACSTLLIGIKIAGGLYLLWLALKSARAALTRDTQGPAANASAAQVYSGRQLYLRGLMLHLTNPKAVLVWLSIVSLTVSGQPSHAGPAHPAVLVASCLTIGVAVFCSYAVLFSTASARRIYVAIRRWFEASLAIAFGAAGVKLLLSKS